MLNETFLLCLICNWPSLSIVCLPRQDVVNCLPFDEHKWQGIFSQCSCTRSQLDLAQVGAAVAVAVGVGVGRKCEHAKYLLASPLRAGVKRNLFSSRLSFRRCRCCCCLFAVVCTSLSLSLTLTVSHVVVALQVCNSASNYLLICGNLEICRYVKWGALSRAW